MLLKPFSTRSVIAACYLYLMVMPLSAVQAQATAFVGCASGSESVSTYNDAFDKQVVVLVNAERKKRNLKPLTWETHLANAARYHAQDMAMDNYMDHDSHDRKGSSLKRVCGTFDRIGKFIQGSNVFACAENIAAGSMTPEEVVKGWMKSSGHRTNILNKSAKYIGVGCYQNEKSQYSLYWAQCFGY